MSRKSFQIFILGYLNLFYLRIIFSLQFCPVRQGMRGYTGWWSNGTITLVPGFPGGTLVAENLPASGGDGGDLGLIPGSGRSPGGGHDNPLRYSCLENPMDRGAWRATIHRVAKSRTWLKLFSMHVPILHVISETLAIHGWSGVLMFYLHLARRQWHPTPVLLPGKSHGRRSLLGCSAWGR